MISGYDPRLLGVDWQNANVLPFPVRGNIEVARSGLLLKTASLSLVCGPTTVHLVLRRNLPLPADYDWLGATDNATIFFGGFQRELTLRSRLVSYGLLETVITQPLTPKNVAHLSAWLEHPLSRKVSFMVLETGSFMKAVAAGSQVQEFASHCSQTSSPVQRMRQTTAFNQKQTLQA
jgi:hypothetical protein